MSAVKSTVRTIRTQQRKASAHSEQIKAGIEAELGRLHKTHALLIATQFAANHDCEFDASDAMAAIIESGAAKQRECAACARDPQFLRSFGETRLPAARLGRSAGERVTPLFRRDWACADVAGIGRIFRETQ